MVGTLDMLLDDYVRFACFFVLMGPASSCSGAAPFSELRRGFAQIPRQAACHSQRSTPYRLERKNNFSRKRLMPQPRQDEQHHYQ